MEFLLKNISVLKLTSDECYIKFILKGNKTASRVFLDNNKERYD